MLMRGNEEKLASFKGQRKQRPHSQCIRRRFLVEPCSLPSLSARFVQTAVDYDINTRTKPHLNVGTIGHVDHGKTTLTAAITKVRRSTSSSTP